MSWERSSTVETRRSVQPIQVGTIAFLVLTALVFLCYLAIFVNPYIPFNPFPPPSIQFPSPAAMAQAETTPTMTPTFTPSPTWPPLWTPTMTPTPTGTYTPRPTPTNTRIPPPTKRLAAFSLRWDPIFTKQKVYDSVGDWWTGLAGEVSDRNSRPVTDVTIRVWDDRGHSWETRPGDASDYADEYGTAYGGGGTFAWWEQVLEASCHESIAAHVQVIRNGQPVSPVVTVQTTGDCDKNLVIIHFVRNY